MKRILMRGAAMLVLGGFIAACSHDDVDYSPIVEGKLKAYQEVFVDAYGQIDPNQTWGFTSVSGQEQSAQSRVTRSANADANMWAKYGYSVPVPLTYAQNDKVRRLFLQHQNPEGISLDYSTFFVQDVYKGGTNVTSDSKTTEQYVAANGDKFYGSDKMDKLTAGRYNDHINNYNNAHCSTNNQVWDGVTYQEGWPRDNVEQAENWNHIVYHSDEIMLMVGSSTDCFGYTNSIQGQQQYNDQFVIIAGDMIQNWDDTQSVGGESADVSGMWFVGFDYEADLKHGWNNIYNSNGYLATEVAEGTTGAFQVPNEGPYKGKWVIDGGADGYYSDWIVRITPGVMKDEIDIPIDEKKEVRDQITVVTTTERFETTELIEQGRVFCEDLGKIDRNDLDFNDAVFDAYVYRMTPRTKTVVTEDGVEVSNNTIVGSPQYRTTIILLAAGGTLTLSVAGYEVHNALGGNNIGTIINTIENDGGAYSNPWTTHAPVELGTDFSYSSIVGIPIVVQYNSTEVLTLGASSGWAPHKILAPIGTKWCKERVDIATAYNDFRNYVSYSEDCWTNNITYSNIYNHPQDTYQPRSTDPVTVRVRVDTSTTYRDKGTTSIVGGYEGEEVLSRQSKTYNE